MSKASAGLDPMGGKLPHHPGLDPMRGKLQRRVHRPGLDPMGGKLPLSLRRVFE